ncbi:MAG: hypothetical protein M0C28_19570 [Candidatus Moduliflexus flocculans]|nr:hypothetical protein [Candidatus Moduliflexus flocculans]
MPIGPAIVMEDPSAGSCIKPATRMLFAQGTGHVHVGATAGIAGMGVIHGNLQYAIIVEHFARFSSQEFHRLTGDHPDHTCRAPKELQGVGIVR